ncbi:MAG TPA: hypothetical protein VI168_10600 [Croceibacterium sp.]
MRLEVWPQADSDFEQIIAHYNALAPAELPGVLADIDRSLTWICEFPRAYPRLPGREYRRHVTSRYRFRIVYRAFSDRVEVMAIFRP